MDHHITAYLLVFFSIKGTAEMLSLLGYSTSVECTYILPTYHLVYQALYHKYQAATAHTVISHLISTSAIGTHL